MGHQRKVKAQRKQQTVTSLPVLSELEQLREENRKMHELLSASPGMAAMGRLLDQNKALTAELAELRKVINDAIDPQMRQWQEHFHAEKYDDDGTAHILTAGGEEIGATENLIVSYTAWIVHKGETYMLPLPPVAYPGTPEDFLKDVPQKVLMDTEKVPQPQDLPPAWDTLGLTARQIGDILRSLALARSVSMDAYGKRRLELWHEYRSIIEDHVITQPYRVFTQDCCDAAFKKQAERIGKAAQVLKSLDKPLQRRK